MCDYIYVHVRAHAWVHVVVPRPQTLTLTLTLSRAKITFSQIFNFFATGEGNMVSVGARVGR